MAGGSASNVLKKVRLHGATLTRFDRDGLGKIARCSQMLHIEIGYSQITSYLSITKMAVPERIELSHSARQADIMATRSWDPTGASGGDRTHWLRRARFYGPVPYLHGGACKMAEETGVEPACARISDTDWFSGPASHRGTPLPFWRRVRDLNSRHLAVLLVSSEVV
jgi:hypothetical protein